MKRGRNVEIAMSVYVALGIAILHKVFDPYGLVFSGGCGLLTLAVIMAGEKNRRSFGEYDSWGWSKSATKGVLVATVVAGVGGLPFWLDQIYGYLRSNEAPEIPFLALGMLMLMAALMGIVVYFRGYLRPVATKAIDSKALRLEHNEWFGMFQVAGVLLGVMVVATGYSYLREVLEETAVLPLADLSSLAYLGIGYVVWLLRPLHGRGKEIRDHMIRARQEGKSSKQTGPRNDTET